MLNIPPKKIQENPCNIGELSLWVWKVTILWQAVPVHCMLLFYLCYCSFAKTFCTLLSPTLRMTSDEQICFPAVQESWSGVTNCTAKELQPPRWLCHSFNHLKLPPHPSPPPMLFTTRSFLNKHSMAHSSTALSQGFIDAGDRNITTSLQSWVGSSAVVSMVMFCQFLVLIPIDALHVFWTNGYHWPECQPQSKFL